MNRLGMLALSSCCALVALTGAPLLALLLVRNAMLAAIVCPLLLGLGLLGSWGLWMQGERRTVFAGFLAPVLLDVWWLLSPFQ